MDVHAFLPVPVRPDEAEAVFSGDPARWMPAVVSDGGSFPVMLSAGPLNETQRGTPWARAQCTVGPVIAARWGLVRRLSWHWSDGRLPAVEANLELRRAHGGVSLVLTGRYAGGNGDPDEQRRLAYGAAIRFLALTAPGLSTAAALLRSMLAHPSARHLN